MLLSLLLLLMLMLLLLLMMMIKIPAMVGSSANDSRVGNQSTAWTNL